MLYVYGFDTHGVITVRQRFTDWAQFYALQSIVMPWLRSKGSQSYMVVER